MYDPDPNADYEGGPFAGTYESVDTVTLPSGARFLKGDPFDAAVAALRTLDIKNYDRTFHKFRDAREIPFKHQQRMGRPVMSAWYYDASGMMIRVVVSYAGERGTIDRLDLYHEPTVMGDAYAQTRKKNESLDLYERRRAAGQYVGDLH